MATSIDYDPEGTTIVLPDGRTLHVWHHDCESCTSVDVWTTDGKDHDGEVTVNGDVRRTSAEDRAPFGLFTMAGGSRWEMAGGADPLPVVPFKRATQTTAILLWQDGAK